MIDAKCYGWTLIHGRPAHGILTLFALGLVAALALTGCGGGESKPTSAPAESAVKLPLMGEAVTVGDATLTADRITRTVGDQIDRPKRGRTWAVTVVIATNKGSKDLSLDPNDFSVTTSSGETVSANPDVRFLEMLKTTSLAPSQSVEGRLAFNVPEKDELVLKWSPKWASQPVSIKLVKP